MHVLQVIVGGFVLLGLFWGIAKLMGANPAKAALAFIPLWLVIALVNMWVGVTRAGYSIAEETPILFVIFGIPAAIAWFLSRRSA